jgi:hypothetical protein
MARSFPLGEGGSATGVLITDRCQGPGGDDGGVHLFSYEEQSTSEQRIKKGEQRAWFALLLRRHLKFQACVHFWTFSGQCHTVARWYGG